MAFGRRRFILYDTRVLRSPGLESRLWVVYEDRVWNELEVTIYMGGCCVIRWRR